MDVKKDIRPITYLKSKASDLLRQINETHRHVIITQNGEAKAVLQDPQSFEEMKNALTMMKLISQSEEDFRNGNVYKHEDVFKSIYNLLDEKIQENDP